MKGGTKDKKTVSISKMMVLVFTVSTADAGTGGGMMVGGADRGTCEISLVQLRQIWAE